MIDGHPGLGRPGRRDRPLPVAPADRRRRHAHRRYRWRHRPVAGPRRHAIRCRRAAAAGSGRSLPGPWAIPPSATVCAASCSAGRSCPRARRSVSAGSALGAAPRVRRVRPGEAGGPTDLGRASSARSCHGRRGQRHGGLLGGVARGAAPGTRRWTRPAAPSGHSCGHPTPKPRRWKFLYRPDRDRPRSAATAAPDSPRSIRARAALIWSSSSRRGR